jgi:hypothetical protein
MDEIIEQHHFIHATFWHVSICWGSKKVKITKNNPIINSRCVEVIQPRDESCFISHCSWAIDVGDMESVPGLSRGELDSNRVAICED